MGKAAGVAAIILAGGTHGKRFAFPNSRIMLTKIFGSLESAAIDIETVVGVNQTEDHPDSDHRTGFRQDRP